MHTKNIRYKEWSYIGNENQFLITIIFKSEKSFPHQKCKVLLGNKEELKTLKFGISSVRGKY